MKRNGKLGMNESIERKEKVRKDKSSQHGTMCLHLKKTTKGSKAPIMQSLTIHTL
jgi:hypothetical protein